MNFTSRADLEAAGFEGFISVRELQATECSAVPSEPGVYLVMRDPNNPPDFLEVSVGGYHQERNPTVPHKRLVEEWVSGALVIYIGKADILRKRLRKYMRFGEGKPVAHHGGRLIWQLGDNQEVLVCWKPVANPSQYENDLIGQFKQQHGGKRPFANLRD
jgi:excinuclease UvrABC nuclease subunit